jgi:hypothetical protein
MNAVVKHPTHQMIVLTFEDLECRIMQIAGDFNDWVPDQNVETRKIKNRWQKVFTVEPGIYEYQLLIDGKWQQDPTNSMEVPNDRDGVNSVLRVELQH